MKHVLLALLVLAAVAYAADAPGAAPAPVDTPVPADLVGKPAPAFSLSDFEGKKHNLADFKGKVVVIDWFNYGCPVVRKYYTNKDFVAGMNKSLVGKKDVVWLSITSSAEGQEGYDPAGFKTAAQDFGKVNVTLRDVDGRVGHAYHATATPTVFVIGKDGRVVYAGAFDEAAGPKEAPKGANLVLAAVDAARAGKQPAVKETRPFGCSIRYAKQG